MDVRIAQDWKEILSEEFSKPYFTELVEFVRAEYAAGEVFPKGRDIFRAFDFFSDKCHPASSFQDKKILIFIHYI